VFTKALEKVLLIREDIENIKKMLTRRRTMLQNQLHQQQPQQQEQSVDSFDEDEDGNKDNLPTDLRSLYYNPRVPGSFGGVDALYRSAGKGKSKSDIRQWFESQPTYTLHKPARIKFKRNVILVHGIDEQFQADLADMSMLARWNDDAHFWLTCIDVLSKYAWVIPIRNKSAHTVMTAFKEIFKERKPLKLQTDQGTEFTNAVLREYMKQEGVQHFFTWNPEIKASIVERFNRTIKQKVFKYMTYKDTQRYLDVLPDMVHSYNNTYHRSIRMTPTEASNPENERRVWRNLYSGRIPEGVKHKKDTKRVHHPHKFKYKLGDYVRLSEERGVFRKGYKQRWTEEVFRVIKQTPRDPVVYKVEDLKGEPLVGSFYEVELQRVSKPVATILDNHHQQQIPEENRRRLPPGERGIEYYIKFRGYPDYDNRFGLQRPQQ
jgi:hypothetical protein